MIGATADFKEQMAEARRTQILMGAAQVFAEKGYHKSTTKEIATAAGVSEGTIYNYFGNKRELLLAMVDPGDVGTIDDVRLITGMQVRAVAASWISGTPRESPQTATMITFALTSQPCPN